MSDKTDSASDRPHPRESYGNPRAAGGRYRFSDHRPGHDDSSAAVQGAPDKRGNTVVVPPHNPATVPRTSLAERIRQGLSAKEHKS